MALKEVKQDYETQTEGKVAPIAQDVNTEKRVRRGKRRLQ